MMMLSPFVAVLITKFCGQEQSKVWIEINHHWIKLYHNSVPNVDQSFVHNGVNRGVKDFGYILNKDR